jgi:hypothetical protein
MFSNKERANYEITSTQNQYLGKYFPNVLQRKRAVYGEGAIELI